jgi:hypothetical protein
MARKGGDSFMGKSTMANPVSNLYAPSEMRWTDRILFAVNSMLGIDVPEKLRLSVFVQSYAIGKPSDSAVDLTMPAKDWSLVGFVKAFAPLALGYQAELQQVNAALVTLNIKIDQLDTQLQALNTTAIQINTGVSAVFSEVQDVDINLTTLNTTATDIRTRMDAPFTTI